MTGQAILTLLLAGSLNFQAVLDQVRAEQDVPGISAVVTVGRNVRFAGASGLADLESARPMTAGTLLYAGSLTKVLTAALVLRLVDEGFIGLDDRVEIPGLDAEPITVAELLNHSSGLPREGEFGYWFSADFPDRQALANYLVDVELRSPPGAEVHYSNIGYAVLGQLIEAVTGQDYQAALDEEILRPLQMQATGSPGPVDGIATGYTPTGRVLPNADRPFAGVGRAVRGRHVREYHDARAMTPAFGVYTSADDLGRLLRFLLGYADAEVLSAALREQLVDDRGTGRTFGLGISHFRGHRVARHGGWFAAHRSHIMIDPLSGIGVAVLTNSDSASPGEIAEALLQEALDSGERSD